MQHLPISLKEQGIDTREDGHLPAQFQAQTLQNLWMGLKNEYHDLVSTGNIVLLPLGSTHLYEVSFFSSDSH